MADIEITAADGHTFTAHRAYPTGEPQGGVVVIQEIFGVNKHIRAVADRFAIAGFVAVAPALFDRVERGVELGYDEEGMQKGRAIAWEQLPIESALADLTAAIDSLADELGGPDRVAAVGFCYGGMLSAALASRAPDHLAAAVAYYPSRAAQLLTDDQVQRPLMIHLGDEDQGVTQEDGRTLTARWPSAVVHRYEGAGHGFNCDLRASHHADASARAWDRSLAFLTEQLTGDNA
ncbi:MAG: dienelactone hydrolase family protein [Acidimicrobiia bacterium]|nr:dienelactone hydrolase family protein [Acidimicrobiia bacterium]